MPKLADKSLCTGCTACASVCPQECIIMETDKYGFAYPCIADPQLCIECGACERSCPILNPETPKNRNPRAYAAFSKDPDVRGESSSGGVFSELAKTVLKNGGAVYGAAYSDDFSVRHICVEKEEDLSRLRGSKYTESTIEEIFPEIRRRLEAGQYVLFSGTPCQAGGLKSFIKGADEKLICVDLVCHGLPSPLVWEKYIEYRSEKDAAGARPVKINLRSKESGWSHYQYSDEFCYPDGTKQHTPSAQSLFMKLFIGDFISRSSCESCRFKGYGRASDITIGDFWGVWEIEPEMDDNKGTSVVLIHSEKGAEIWESIQGNIEWKEVSLEAASRYNPSMLRPSPSNIDRDKVLDEIMEGKFSDSAKYFEPTKKSVFQRAKNKAKRLLRGND